MLTELSTARKPAQMVWAAIWLDERGQPRRSDLIVMQRDLDAPHRGYSAQSYIQALQQGLLPHWRDFQLFMHDNASIHTARGGKLHGNSPHSCDWMATILTRPQPNRAPLVAPQEACIHSVPAVQQHYKGRRGVGWVLQRAEKVLAGHPRQLNPRPHHVYATPH